MGFKRLDPSPTPPLQGEGLSGSPFPRREGGWGVRFSEFTNSIIYFRAGFAAYPNNAKYERKANILAIRDLRSHQLNR